MPSKNKPKRLDRQKAWRVQRRKRKIRLLVNGNSRNRAPRPKNKSVITTTEKKVSIKKIKEEKAPKITKKKIENKE